MEPFLIFLLLFFSILFISIYKLLNFQAQKVLNHGNRDLQLPPGARGWPFLGEILNYIYHVLNGTPEKFVEDRRKKYSSRIFKTSFVGKSIAILCGAEGNKFLFSNEKKLVQVWWPPVIDQLFPKSGNKLNTDESIKLRRIISSFLKPDSLRKGVGLMDSEMKRHLQSDWMSEKVIISSMAKKYTSAISCKLFFSITELKIIDEFTKMIEVISNGLHSMPVNLPGTALNRGIKASKTIRKEIEEIVKQRRIDTANQKCSFTVYQDVITHMLLTADENGEFFNEFDIASHLLSLLQASYSNIHNTITLFMMYLAELPDVYDKVLREQMEIAESKEPNDLLSWEDLSRMKFTWNVVCEVLRILPPLGTFREAITDFEYAGYLIPKGWKMHWIARATHRNPEYFPNPEKFDPTRFEGNGPAPYTFVPFGGGPRICPGIEYARLAMLVFIHNVMIKFKWEKLIPNEKLVHGPASSPAYGLPVHLHPLKP